MGSNQPRHMRMTNFGKLSDPRGGSRLKPERIPASLGIILLTDTTGSSTRCHEGRTCGDHTIALPLDVGTLQ